MTNWTQRPRSDHGGETLTSRSPMLRKQTTGHEGAPEGGSQTGAGQGAGLGCCSQIRFRPSLHLLLNIQVRLRGTANILLLTLCDLALVGFWPCYRAANRQITETPEITTSSRDAPTHKHTHSSATGPAASPWLGVTASCGEDPHPAIRDPDHNMNT